MGVLRSMPRLMRYRLHSGRSDALLEPFGEGFELPHVRPDDFGRAEATVAWGAGVDTGRSSVFLDRTLRLDLARANGAPGSVPTRCNWRHCSCRRPVQAPKTMACCWCRRWRCEIDAQTMQCLATLHAPQVIPFGFHAAWAE